MQPSRPAACRSALPATPLPQVVCGQLLIALVRRPAVCAALLDTPAWDGLCDAVGRGDPGLLQLAEKVQRRLLQSLLLAAHGLPGDAAGAWAGRLLESTAAQLRQAGASEAAARAALQRADGLHLVVSLLERLRGAVRGTLPGTQAALFQQVGGCEGRVWWVGTTWAGGHQSGQPPYRAPCLCLVRCQQQHSYSVSTAHPATSLCSSRRLPRRWPPSSMPAARSPWQ